MAYEDILYEVEAGVATVTLNRPDRLNAWRGVMEGELRLAMRVAADDPGVRVIVLTGAGRGFCAGADMDVLQDAMAAGGTGGGGPDAFDPASRPDFRLQYPYFPAVPKPILGAINGACAGLGLVMALYTDIRLASDTAVFTTAFSRRGLIAEHGISWLLPRIVGMANAAEALRIGLVNRVFPAASFRDDVAAYARMLATEVSPRSLAIMKRELWNSPFQSLSEAIVDANADMALSLKSDDFKEGVAHFLEKRPARFTGR